MRTQHPKAVSVMGAALAAVLLLAALPNTTFAGFISYSDRATFLAAASGASLTATNEDFTVDPGDPFTITDGANGVTLDLTQGVFSGGQISGTGNGNIILSSTALTGLLYGIGFEYTYGPPFISNPGITTPETGRLGGPSVGFGTVGFFGILSVGGMTISAVSSLTTGQGNGSSTMDNIVIVTGTAAVPEPSILLLFTLGALGLSGVRYRQSRRHPTV